MYMDYPEDIKFNIIDNGENEIIGYAKRCIAEDWDVEELRRTESKDKKREREIFNSLDDEFFYL